MADNWTVLAADNATLTLQVSVNGETTTLVASLADLDATNEQDLLNALRDLATEFREQRMLALTPPIVVGDLVGRTEEF